MGWLAIQTKARREDLAARNLRAQGYDTFFPYFLEIQRARAVRKPYLTRYIFAAMTQAIHSVYQIRSTIGVSNVVHLGDTALEVPDPVMEELMGRAEGDGQVVMGKRPEPPFPGEPGDQVKFAEGSPFFGLLGELCRIDIGGRLTILLELMLGAAREVTVHRTDVGLVIHKDGSITDTRMNGAGLAPAMCFRRRGDLL